MSGRSLRAIVEPALAAIGVATVAILVRLQPLRSADLLWQLRTGEVVASRGAAVHADLFTFALRGAPIRDHEAAFEAFVAWSVHRGGFPLLWWLNLGLVVVAALAAAHVARRLVRDVPSVVVASAVVLAAASTRLELRAETATFCAIALAYAARRRADVPIEGAAPRAWAGVAWRLAPLGVAVVAAPFHGLALLVAAAPAAHLGEALVAYARRSSPPPRPRHVALDAAVMAAIVLAVEIASPGLLANVLASATGPTFMQHIIEWYSPLRYARASGDVTPLVAIGVAFASVGGLLAMVRDGRARIADALLVSALALLGCRFVRLTALPLLAALPWAIAGIAELVRLALLRLRPRAASLAVQVAAFALVLAHVGAGAQLRGVAGFDWGRQPRAAVAWLRARRPNAALFHGYNQGALLIYEQYPPRGVVIDPRAWTLYPEWYARRYYDALAMPEAFEAWADTAPFDTVLLPRNHAGTSALTRHLSETPRWSLAYEDELARVFVRRGAGD